MKVVPVIISGGAGSRLWPASRQSHPKPFLKVADGHSLIQHTVLRAASIEGVVELVAVISGDHLFLTKDDFDQLDSVVLPRTFLLEPEGRDTAAAVAAATIHAKATQGPDAILCVFPADHMIGNLPAFLNVMGRAIDHAKQGRIATLGIKAYGLSLVEAAMCGKPMISCEIGTGTSYVNKADETGLVVPPSDPARLAEAINRLVDSPGEAAKWGRAARDRYTSLFTSDRMGKAYADLYRQLDSRRH